MTRIIDAAKTGASWSADQVPALVQEWLRWQLTESAVVATALITLGLILTRVTYKYSVRKDWESFMPLQLFTGVAVVCFLGIGIFDYALTALKVLIAPRVVVLEQFIQLVK